MNKTLPLTLLAALAVALSAFSDANPPSAESDGRAVSKGVWWWRGQDADDPAAAARRFDFLAARDQIDEKRYATEMEATGIFVLKYGIGFLGKHVVLAKE